MAGDAHSSDSDRRIPCLDVECLAGYTLAALMEGSFGKQTACHSSEVKDLYNALTKSDDASYRQHLLTQIASGGTTDDLIDITIPDLARRLGDDWLDDKLNFADVTIGVSRLQQTVRRHGARKEADGLKSPLGEQVLLAIPEADQHSLGAFIIANQLRRAGVWVQLELDCKLDQVGALIDGQNFAMIGFSLGTQRALDKVGSLTTAVRDQNVEVPIILGGAALADHDTDTAPEFGANFIARNAQQALDFCQIDTARTSLFSLNDVNP